jgi:dethiobiotin synthetase
MADNRPPGLFITGTDTGVGKTYVAALISMSLARAGYRVGVYKPVASGCWREGPGTGDQGPEKAEGRRQKEEGNLVSDDAVALWEGAGRPGELSAVCPQLFQAPLAPHLAARAEGKRVDAKLLRDGIAYWRERSDIVIVEGAGGLMSPISDDDYVADLAFEFGYPLVVVTVNKIGVINQTLQTLIVAETFREGIPIAGIVLNDVSADVNDPSRESNYDELCRHCVPPVIATVSFQAQNFNVQSDWFPLAGPPK